MTSGCDTAARDAERGVALPGVVLLAAFLVGITGWLVGHVRADLAMSVAYEDEAHARRLAGAAVEAAAMALGQVVDWQAVGALAVPLSCPVTGGAVAPIDEAQERTWLQAVTDAGSRWGADTPEWRVLWTCHGAGVLGVWPPRGRAASVVVWVADDPEGDGQPLTSVNERLLLHAVARGGGGARGAAGATVARQGPGAPVTLAAWRGASGS